MSHPLIDKKLFQFEFKKVGILAIVSPLSNFSLLSFITLLNFKELLIDLDREQLELDTLLAPLFY